MIRKPVMMLKRREKSWQKCWR